MEPEELFDDDLDLEGEDWEDDTLALDEEESDAHSLARELGVPLDHHS
jgi:hypothetical protein